MSRADRFEFTLDEDTEKRLYELLTDMDTRNTNRFWITDKRGYRAEYVKVVRCKDCKWFGDIGCAISIVDDTDKPSGNDYCSFAERKEE